MAVAVASGLSSPLRRAGMTLDSEGYCRVSHVDFGHSSTGPGPPWLFRWMCAVLGHHRLICPLVNSCKRKEEILEKTLSNSSTRFLTQ